MDDGDKSETKVGDAGGMDRVGATLVINDEISLVDLWCVLVRKRWIIVTTVGVAMVVGLVYAFLAPPVYRAEAWLLPPLVENVQGLNVQGLNVQGFFSPNRVYTLFEMNLKSRVLRRKFFSQHKVADQLVPDRGTKMSTEDIFDKQFNKNLKVRRKKKDRAVITVSFEGRDPKLAAEWVNGIIAMARRETMSDLADDVAHRITLARQSILKKIANKRELARQQRLDRIDRLQVALAIASSMNLAKNQIKLAFGARLQTGNMSTGELPLYLLGSKALRAQVTQLKKRTNDDPFILGLRDLEMRLARLGHVRVVDQMEGVSVARLDQAAVVPDYRIKPKRKLIVLLALFGGLMLGIFAALFAEFLDKYRLKQHFSAMGAR